MAVKAKANIRLKLQSEKQLASLLDALTPEAKAPATRRAKVQLQKNGLSLTPKLDELKRFTMLGHFNLEKKNGKEESP